MVYRIWMFDIECCYGMTWIHTNRGVEHGDIQNMDECK